MKSRNFILHQTPNPLKTASAPRLTFGMFLRNNIEFGASLALMVLVVYVMLGGFSTLKWSAPLQVANLDPASLKAEAQAVDLQIKLTNLQNYEAGNFERSLRVGESTPSSTLAGGLANGVHLGSNSASVTLSVDEALDKLSR